MAGMALFCMAAVVAAGAPPGGGKSRWVENFDGPGLNPNFWVIANEPAPGYRPGLHRGLFQPDRVSIAGGYLVLRLTQENGLVDGSSGVISRGGLIYTGATYGYGTYEMRMRMSTRSDSPDFPGDSVSGSVSAGFVYDRNSQKEIDVEFSGHHPNTVYFVNWRNKSPASDPTEDEATATPVPLFGISDVFHIYKFVWRRGRIDYYVDGVLKATHTTDVPISRAHFMLTHWGANSPLWGGTATVGSVRYFYIDWVKYTP